MYLNSGTIQAHELQAEQLVRSFPVSWPQRRIPTEGSQFAWQRVPLELGSGPRVRILVLAGAREGLDAANQPSL